jgi:uncharacterized protein (TIGR03000 family)
MLRKWIGIASVIAVAAVMLAADASQARERRFGRRNRSYDYDNTAYVADSTTVIAADGAYMPTSGTMVFEPQERRRFGRRSRGTSYSSNGYYAPGGNYVAPPSAPGVQRSSGYYSPDGVAAPGREMPVYLEVLIPPTAEIIIEGAKTTQTGSRRLFVSPPIKSGQNYTYDLKAKWTENGKEMNRSRKVPVRAGETKVVDLTRELMPERQ